MRLLDVRSHKFAEFAPNKIPQYAILSHTWESEEVTYEDLASTDISLRRLGKAYRNKDGWKKIRFACDESIKDSLNYVWVDTCCIDKRSSAELSEAINSMFAWYSKADRCYVYLGDVVRPSAETLKRARWFTRGWTLQELLAPQTVEFFTQNWGFIGQVVKTEDETSLAKDDDMSFSSMSIERDLTGWLAETTGIQKEVLNGTRPLESVCIGRRMSWASTRETTRPEDIAYCLLGIFGINMPTIYGEGEKAFVRLQEEILKISDDHSLFAWIEEDAPPSEPYGLLAKSPASFRASKDMEAFRDWTGTSPYSVSNLGLSITLPFESVGPGEYRASLNCSWSTNERTRIGVHLRQIPGAINQYQRIRCSDKTSVELRSINNKRQIYVRQDQILPSSFDVLESKQCCITLPDLSYTGSSNYHLSSMFYTENATRGDDWYERLLKQEVTASATGLRTTFYLPGERATLSMVLCIENVADAPPPESQRPTSQVSLGGTILDRAYMQEELRDVFTSGHTLESINSRRKTRHTPGPNMPQKKFLVLIGTAQYSHEPTFILADSSDSIGQLEKLVNPSSNEDAANAGVETDSKEKCHKLFEGLSELFRGLAVSKWERPHYSINGQIGTIIAQKSEEVHGNTLDYELKIDKPEIYELEAGPVSRMFNQPRAPEHHDESLLHTKFAELDEASRRSEADDGSFRSVAGSEDGEAGNRPASGSGMFGRLFGFGPSRG